MLSVWIDFRLDMHGLKMQALSRVVDVKNNSTLLRTVALIVYAHPYCARNSCHNAMLRHAGAHVQRKKSIHMKGGIHCVNFA